MFIVFNCLCRCWVRNPTGGQSDQTQFGGQRGRPRDGVHEVSEHLQEHRDQIQTERALRRDDRRRQEDEGQYEGPATVNAPRPARGGSPCGGSPCGALTVYPSSVAPPADRGDSGKRQACAETELGRQRDLYRKGDLGRQIDSGKILMKWSHLRVKSHILSASLMRVCSDNVLVWWRTRTYNKRAVIFNISATKPAAVSDTLCHLLIKST